MNSLFSKLHWLLKKELYYSCMCIYVSFIHNVLCMSFRILFYCLFWRLWLWYVLIKLSISPCDSCSLSISNRTIYIFKFRKLPVPHSQILFLLNISLTFRILVMYILFSLCCLIAHGCSLTIFTLISIVSYCFVFKFTNHFFWNVFPLIVITSQSHYHLKHCRLKSWKLSLKSFICITCLYITLNIWNFVIITL